MIRVFVVLAIALGISACVSSSPPPVHLQLSAAGVEPGSQSAPRVLVGALKLPDYLLRDELLTRVDEYQLSYDTRYRWAEPLDLGMQRVIALRLSALLDSYGVVSYPSAPIGGVDWRISITVRRFEAIGDRAIIVADSVLSRRGADVARTLRFESERTVTGSEGSAVAATLSQLLADFVGELGQELKQAERESPRPPESR